MASNEPLSEADLESMQTAAIAALAQVRATGDANPLALIAVLEYIPRLVAEVRHLQPPEAPELGPRVYPAHWQRWLRPLAAGGFLHVSNHGTAVIVHGDERTELSFGDAMKLRDRGWIERTSTSDFARYGATHHITATGRAWLAEAEASERKP